MRNIGNKPTPVVLLASVVVLAVLAFPAAAQHYHSADTTHDYAISLNELLRVIQFYNSDGFCCQGGTEDYYAPGPGDTSCAAHDSDYAPQDWAVSLSELLRLSQFFYSAGYHTDCASEDTFAPGPGSHELCEDKTIMLPGNVPLEMVWIPAGTFLMRRYLD